MNVNDLMNVSVDELSTLDLESLVVLRGKLDKAIETKKSNAKFELLREFRAKAKGCGFSFDELMSGKTKRQAPVKYRNPNNMEEGWSGYGRKPRWLEQLLASGHSLESLAVQE